MRITVVGGTGLVGSLVVRELLARGADVCVLSRSAASREKLPGEVDLVVGDLLAPKTVSSAFEGADAVFLLNAVSTTECHEGLMALCGIREANVARVVYLSVHDAERAPHVPHYGSKLGVEAAIEASGAAWTILRPNNFFQNDAWARESMLYRGVYDQPIGRVGLSRVDARDIAEAAAIALTTPGHEGRRYDLVGPEILTGDAIAAIWSEALGRPIRYVDEDLEAWQRRSEAFMPPWMAFDLARMYAFFRREGLTASPEAIARLTALLGHPPRSLAAYARETAAAWGLA